MVLASRVHRLAELRKRQHTTQVQVAEAMGVTQARVSRIDKGQKAGMPVPPARSRSARVPCGVSSTSGSPARYWRANSLFSPT